MKIQSFTFLLSLCAISVAAIEPSESWFENQKVLGINKESAHATYTPYPTLSALIADKSFFDTPWVETKSSLRQNLNGQWKFNYAPTPDKAPANFYQNDYDSSSWDKIPVPSCWAMHGYDTPMYMNVNYGFDSSQYPRIVARDDNNGYDVNPVGSYLTEFTVPASWSDKELFLNFEGIYSAAYVWINGQFAGYSQAANTNHEFDITKYAVTGTNRLAVKVIKWSDGSYLECQDMMRWGGIFRDVTLTAVPKIFVRDHYITAEFPNAATNDFSTAKLKIELSLANRSSQAANVSAAIKVLDPQGKEVANLSEKSASVSVGEENAKLTFEETFSAPKLWSCETPELYTVIVSLKDAAGKETEAFATKYGFRDIRQKGSFIYINGRKVFFKGVNRQDTHPVTGRMQTLETLLQDVKMFKQHNINTVRTSHCPHAPKMMAMYDYFGIYVMDEADLETHAIDWELVNNPDWTDAYVDREVRMVLRDRNHPSVIFWSMGNESRNGSNFAACREAIRNLDGRMVHYEGQQVYDNSDFTSKMYPYERDVISADNSNDERPHFFCEYAHSMGQSLGNFVDYWDYIENSKRIIGGCIWDWADQAIYSPQEVMAGTYKQGDYRTGYDYPGPHQDNFVSNGIVGPERKPTAKLAEVKKVHQWIKMSNFGPRLQKVRVNNTYNFIDLSSFKMLWSISRNGRDIQSGIIEDANVEPGKSKQITIPYNPGLITDDAEYLVTLKFVTREATPWAEAGHVVAEEQFAINERPTLPDIDLDGLDANLETRGNGPVVISGEGFSYEFDVDGNLVSMNIGGHELIYNGQGLKFDSYRWIENDAPYSGVPPAASSMVSAKVTGTKLVCSYDGGDARGAKAVHLSATLENSTDVKYTNYYTIYADGTLDVTTTYYNKNSNLLRLGQSISLTPALENLEYFARGPWSNYADRKTASFAAVYNTTVTDEHEEFVRPQSMGNHEELRYLKLTSTEDSDFGLLIETEGQVSFSALHHTEADYGTVKHDKELQPRPEVILHLDYQQKGIGNGSCGSEVWDRYLIPTYTPMTNRLRFTPLAGKGGGYSVPGGNKGAYLKSLVFNGKEIVSAKSAPEDIYNVIETPVKAQTGNEQVFEFKTSETANVAAWIDLNNDQKFSNDEKLNGMTLLIPADMPSGDYRLRIIVDDKTPNVNSPVNGTVYDLIIRTVTGRDDEVKYAIPDGTLHSDKEAYVKAITSSGATENIAYTAESCPANVYTLLNNHIKAYTGSKFTITFDANEAGPRSTTKAYQDLRYNYAGIFVDFYGTGMFEQVSFHGRWINASTASQQTNILANYDDVMSITQTFEIPQDVPTGEGRIRIIYENAWTTLNNFNPYMQTIKEGIAYDIIVDIEEAEEKPLDFSTLPEPSFDIPAGSMHPDGKAWVKHISTADAVLNIDVELSAPEKFYTELSDTVIADAGTEIIVNYIANAAGPRSTTNAYQDLRYNYATVFLGLPDEIEMQRVKVIGDRISGENFLANYDAVMNILCPVTIPAFTQSGTAIIRIIYQNAWRYQPEYNSQDITEGVAYDIPVKIPAKESSIQDVLSSRQSTASEIYDLQGRCVSPHNLRPGVYIRNNTKILIK